MVHTFQHVIYYNCTKYKGGRCGRDRMVVGFSYTTTCAISILMLWGRTLFMARCTQYKCSVTCGRSVVFTGYSCFLNQQNWQPRDNWKIDESGVKHHKPKPKYIKHLRFWKLAGYIYKTNFKGRLKHFRNLQINIDPTFLYFLKKHFARYFFLYKFLNIRHSADVCLD